MKIAIGADHAGFELKQRLVEHLKGQGHQVQDFGSNSPEPSDYPKFAFPVAESVAQKQNDRGILICGNGIGMSIVANKVPGVRAALTMTEKMAKDTREHNDSNVLVLAGRDLPDENNLKITDIWLSTPFSNAERHARRVGEIQEIEKQIKQS
ncbi:MAG TPA: ribose 5-phosphate isomerase B [bacterium]|nr:ribose 5-phosphate isomerase B [bacterium]